MYEGLPSLVMQHPMKVHYKGDEIVPSELVTLISGVIYSTACTALHMYA